MDYGASNPLLVLLACRYIEVLLSSKTGLIQVVVWCTSRLGTEEV
ncbi:MAG TPA: hypothetical protein VGM23_04695 [Armatimonadota bacterium]